MVKSPLVAAACCGYRITSSGLVEVSGASRFYFFLPPLISLKVELPADVVADERLPSATDTHIQTRDTAGQAFAAADAQFLTVLQAQRSG